MLGVSVCVAVRVSVCCEADSVRVAIRLGLSIRDTTVRKRSSSLFILFLIAAARTFREVVLHVERAEKVNEESGVYAEQSCQRLRIVAVR